MSSACVGYVEVSWAVRPGIELSSQIQHSPEHEAPPGSHVSHPMWILKQQGIVNYCT